MSSFRLVARGRYSLAALYEGGAAAAIDLAFPVERSWVAVLLRSFG